MTYLRTFLLSVTLLFASSVALAEPLGLSGLYKVSGKYKDKNISMRFDGDKCFISGGPRGGELADAEAKCLRKGNLLYISNPNRQRMTRNIWLVYTVVDDRLESSHLEDMDNGDIFYKKQQPEMIFQKQCPKAD